MDLDLLCLYHIIQKHSETYKSFETCMKSKIGIITLHQITNYGGILQAYALSHTIASMGYDVEVIEKSMYLKPLSFIEKCILYPWRFFLKKCMKRKIAIRKEENQNSKVSLLYESAEYTLPFVKKHIPHRYIQSFNEIHEGEYHTFVVGSDQIWRPMYVREVFLDIQEVFLNFTKNWDVRRISYAASFGSEEWEYTQEQTKHCIELISHFNAISCRETKGADFCKEHLNFANSVTVIDPTMLLEQEDYITLVRGYLRKNTGDLMCYVLDENQRNNDIVNYIAKKMSMKPFSVKAKEPYFANSPIETRLQPPVEEWLKGFEDAKFIITDSYHACVFSIIFRKPFAVIVNPVRGVARYKTLLSYFNLEYRMISEDNKKQIDDILTTPLHVDELKMKNLQVEAINYLKNNL